MLQIQNVLFQNPESAVIARNDAFKAVLIARFSYLKVKPWSRKAIFYLERARMKEERASNDEVSQLYRAHHIVR